MASTTPKVIFVRSNNPDNMMQRTNENIGNGAIIPGELLTWVTSGADLDQHATAGGNRQNTKVAIENQFSDHGDGPNIDHAYADNETVFYIQGIPGDRLYMWATTSQTIVKGAPLASAGNGMLALHTPEAVDEGGATTFTSSLDAIEGYAAADVTTTGTKARILVDIA